MTSEKLQYCPNYSVSISALDTEKKTRYVLRTRCKQWDCEYCAPKNMREWRYRIMATIEKRDADIVPPYAYDQWYLWTLTLSPRYHQNGSTSDSLQQWRKHWNKLMGKLRYNLGKFMYIRVFETHKSGVLHVHMLANRTFDDIQQIIEYDEEQNKNIRHNSAKLRAIMLSYGLGTIHDIKPVNTTNFDDNGNARNVSAYVTKYLTKEIQSSVRSELRKKDFTHVRMIQTSHGWEQITKQSEYEWQVGRITYAQYDNELREGVQTYDLNYSRVVEAMDFEKDGSHEVYPPQSESLNK